MHSCHLCPCCASMPCGVLAFAIVQIVATQRQVVTLDHVAGTRSVSHEDDPMTVSSSKCVHACGCVYMHVWVFNRVRQAHASGAHPHACVQRTCACTHEADVCLRAQEQGVGGSSPHTSTRAASPLVSCGMWGMCDMCEEGILSWCTLHATSPTHTCLSHSLQVPEALCRAWRPAPLSMPGLAQGVFTGGFVGYAGYDTVRYVYGGRHEGSHVS